MVDLVPSDQAAAGYPLRAAHLDARGDTATKPGCEDERCGSPWATVWHCVDCDSNYCSECWRFQGPHRAGKKGRDGVPHEQTDIKLVGRLKGILQPPTSSESIKQSHQIDQFTKWFGVMKDITGRPQFQDFGRYATLMGSLRAPDTAVKDVYPQLVSFIGLTNAGKSTVVSMLANHMPDDSDPAILFPTPVVGSLTNDKVPTSGDVHLYADQASNSSQLPILYADCEGFEGGERMPMGARVKKRSTSDMRQVQAEYAQTHSLPIEWANTEEACQREFAVAELYPRLLYTFSDVVVFVLRNPKTFQSAVLGRLLEWGAAALEKSLNQPALPHAVVLLNDTDPGVDPEQWDSETATRSLLSCVRDALDPIDGVPRFRELAHQWRRLGAQIYTIEDLILRYYSSFTVVRMPRKPQYNLMDRQVRSLHEIIRSSCDCSFRAKRKARMLTNADELNIYLQSAFQHFTRTLDTPFNFVNVSWMNNPVTYDFGGHLLQLAKTLLAKEPALQRDGGRSRTIFERMSPFVASCLLLDCARFRKGQVHDLFEKYYRKYFDSALREYCDLSLPCSFTDGEGRYCKLVKARHIKGHQDDQGIIAHGGYMSSFTAERFLSEWEQSLTSAVTLVQHNFQAEQDETTQAEASDERIALRLHRQSAGSFYGPHHGSGQVFSNASCFCCLMDVPEHPLPCGHVICSACVQSYGRSSGKAAVTLRFCPLHMEDAYWPTPHVVKFKHKSAGTRVLALDGGGIRGIVELETLLAIEKSLGGEIPVQAFFDLIVGTSTGGIIAMALCQQQWSVTQCIQKFTSLCDHAYTPRLNFPLLDIAASIGHGSKYKTTTFHRALREAFGEEDFLFGGRVRSKPATIKVAVTSTSSTGGKAIVLANYRRKEDAVAEYIFERPHEPELELRVWEAAAATTSTPGYFKPFVNLITRRMYLDGAVHNNNPSRIAERERRLLWPDTAACDPDIFLSLGTGQNRISVLPKLTAETPDLRTQQSWVEIGRLTLPLLTRFRSGPENEEKPGGLSRLLQSWGILYNKVDDILNAEVAWAVFRADLTTNDKLNRNSRRYIRFNPDLDKRAPALDAKDDMRSMQATVRKRLALPHCMTAINHVAHRLLASTFLFDVHSRSSYEGGSHSFIGSILCKFDNGTENVRALGRRLKQTCSEDFRPSLLIKPDVRAAHRTHISFSTEVIDLMISQAEFAMTEITILVDHESKASTINLMLSPHDGLEPEGFPLSSFPKVLAESTKSTSASVMPKSANIPVRAASTLSQVPTIRTTYSCSTESTSGRSSVGLTTASTITSGPRRSGSSLGSLMPNPSLDRPLTALDRSASAAQAHAAALSGADSSYSAIKGPNRFWAYIGPQHMARNPHLYSQDVLEKFVPGVAAPPVDPDTINEVQTVPAVEQEFMKRNAGLSTGSPRDKDLDRSDPEPAPTEFVEHRMGDHIIKLPLGFPMPPTIPTKRRGFEPSALDEAIEDAFP